VLAVLAVAIAAAAPPALVPTPIGSGARYRPPAAPAAVRRGEPVGRLACAGERPRFGVHLELFANGRVVVVPAGIGVAAPFVRGLRGIVPGGCTYPARTLTPAGIVEVARGARLTLGDLFRLWGAPLGRTRLAGFESRRPLRAFVGGRAWRGDARSIPLAPHTQIVLELGAYVPPHRSFRFPGGL
jgi:hypothetical protein